MKCEKCNKEHDGSYGSGRFCSKECSHSRVLSDITKVKIRESLLASKGKEKSYCNVCNCVLNRTNVSGLCKEHKPKKERQTSYYYVKQAREKVKEKLILLFGGKCQLCGYANCKSSLHFHHVIQSLKRFTIRANTNLAFNKQLEEAKKCILVCANCHGEIHANMVDKERITLLYEKNLEICS